LQANVDVLLQYLCEKIPIPKRDFKSAPVMTIVRSFDINNPGEAILNLKGGIAGGTLKRGVLKVGQQIEIRPGTLDSDTAANWQQG
jgi:translation initiation factor 2 gamma subunit (eIF-2gamma)